MNTKRDRTPLSGAEERYFNDNNYRRFVDMMQYCIENLHLTPAEVREGAVYACIRVEMRRPVGAVVFEHRENAHLPIGWIERMGELRSAIHSVEDLLREPASDENDHPRRK